MSQTFNNISEDWSEDFSCPDIASYSDNSSQDDGAHAERQVLSRADQIRRKLAKVQAERRRKNRKAAKAEQRKSLKQQGSDKTAQASL
ncbi:unknown protein [Seminavis robusta]|uniref:Uncharacterized protein n=1 Tax=Seminavis robusta TaxID=568900 RepID=A0A9N8H469_9STRA|nr:unknown protein [Seminavis robusta]|eukprot:Sro42_g025670.1 n/a (88) ;mRNA; r:89616-89879